MLYEILDSEIKKIPEEKKKATFLLSIPKETQDELSLSAFVDLM